MATKSKDKTKISSRKPWGRLSDDVKEKIVEEVASGMLSRRAAGRKYGLPTSMIGLWIEKRNLAILLQPGNQIGGQFGPKQRGHFRVLPQGRTTIAEIPTLDGNLFFLCSDHTVCYCQLFTVFF